MPTASGSWISCQSTPVGTVIDSPVWSVNETPASAATPKVAAAESALRRAPLPVIARVSQDSLHLDVLALDERDLEAVADSVAWAIDRVTRPADRPEEPADRIARRD